MGATEIDFVGIAHVKVGLIAHQKIYVCLMGGNDQCGQVKTPDR